MGLLLDMLAYLLSEVRHTSRPRQSPHDVSGGELISQHLHLQEPHEQHGDVAHEEVARDRALPLKIDRPSIELGLHHPEALLDPPEPVVGAVYGAGVHRGLRGHDHVVACKGPLRRRGSM